MYRLMMSVRFVLQHATLGPLSSYRHRLVSQYSHANAALGACDSANRSGPCRYYVLNELGQEHFEGSWIS